MWFGAGMKFWQRVVAVVMLGLTSLLVYFHLPGEDGGVVQMKMRQHYRRMVEGMDYRHGGKIPLAQDSAMCSLQSPQLSPHPANLSTYDLYYNTQFNMKSNGEWEMPLPTQEELAAESARKLTVILLPHSHNDPGWQRTVNEYYTYQTKHILNNMVNKLTQYSNMTFVWAETVYFSMWWTELDDAVKVHVRRLIRRGQLEIALGGWVMPDEASTHYVSLVDQLVEGHQWLWENLRVRPENSWSIDPFGHSATAPYLWHRAGMSNMVVQRVHQAVKTSLVKHKSLEFNWRQMWDHKGTTDILCHMMPFMLYNIKYSCGPDPYSCLHFDFRRIAGDYSESRASEITRGNIRETSEMLYKQFRSKAHYFQHNTILVPIGDDFRYDREKEWDQQYENYERLTQYINAQKEWNIRVQWGTLKDYFQLVRQDQAALKMEDKDADFPVVSGDFFPYSDKDNAYWTGYYTTRPFDKRFSRDLQHAVQAADTLNTLTYAFNKKWGLPTGDKFLQHSSFLQQARRSLGLFQHHDAITGTAKEFVVQDYENYLLRAYNQSQDVMRMSIQTLLSQGKIDSPVVFKPETVRKLSTESPHKQIITVREGGTTLTFFNSLGQPRQQMVHVLVDCQTVEVLSASRRQVVPNQLSPVWSREEDALVEDTVFELTFLADLGPLSVETFILYKKPEQQRPETSYLAAITVYNTETLAVPPSLKFHQNRPEPRRTEPILIDNQVVQLTFDPATGSLLKITDLATNNETDINLSFEYYKAQGSGAYIFFPAGPSMSLFSNIPVFRVVQGPLMTRVEVGFEPYVIHQITLYSHPSVQASAVHIENIVSIQTLKDKEVIMRLSSDIANTDKSYFTDQNGFQFIRRRPNPSLSVEANYYPMTSAAILEDRTTRLTLLSGQPHGVSLLEEGQIEVMLDRQLLHDDSRGLGEPVQDIKTTVSSFILLVERRKQPLATATKSHTTSLSLTGLVLQDMLLQPPLGYFSTVDSDIFYRTVNPVATPLACDVSAVSLRSLANGNLQYNGTSVILHRRGYDCGFPSPSLLCYPSDSSLSFSGLFSEFSFSNVRETSLTHTIVNRAVNPSEKLKLAPMELYAYHLQF
ncbi:alpha-mannosidase 2 [Aplysia californica]|uniref:Alpha-mannosidase n=1 Tax=Aplysia californica TaxID=6500 RepID=A0ABM1W085_APLCA|nr:alpha-mannosidase 2 [Aplysia californica]